jgi:hypothetical protein
MLLGDFIANVGKEDIFKLTIGKEILHDISKDNGVRVVNFTSTKVARLKAKCSRILTHKYSWTSPENAQSK